MKIISSKIESGNLQMGLLKKNAENPVTTIVFIHGFPFEKEMWISQMENLPPRVEGIAYDIRGFGGSFSGHGFFSIDLFASDLIALIKHLQLLRVTICGLSMGGYIALRAYEKEPALFSGIILCDTNASTDTNDIKLNRFSSIEMIQNGETDTFIDNFLLKILNKKTLQKEKDKVAWIREMMLKVSPTTLSATLLALASRTDTSHILSQINIPALIIRGEEDQLMTQQQADLLSQNIPDSLLVQIPSSSHLPNIENPGTFNEVLNRFLLERIQPFS